MPIAFSEVKYIPMRFTFTNSFTQRQPDCARIPRSWTRALTTILLLLAGFSNPQKALAYCNTGLGGGSYADIDSISIVGTTLANYSPGYASSYYTAYPAAGNTTATLFLGSTYTLYASFNGSPNTAIASLWIDYNQNGVFESSEWTQICTNASSATVSFTVPAGATVGTTGMRIRSRGNGNINGSGDACTSFGSGETEDYTISIVSPVPCSGAPTAGSAVASPASICYNSSSNLSLTGATVAAGLSYQWQVFNTATSTWGNIGTASASPGYNTGALTANTQYRCIVTCTNGTPTSATSNPVTVNVTPGIIPPYIETFESITANNTLPSCMSATNLGSQVYTYTSPSGSYNQTNHTPGGSKYASFRWSSSDYIFTPAISLTAGQVYQMSFWYITDGYSGWTTLKATYGNAPTAAAQTNTIGSAVSNATNTTYQQYVGTFTAPTTGVYYFSIYCNATGAPWYLSVDDINIVALPPCSGQPTAGTGLPAGPIAGCAGNSYFLTTTGTTTATGLTYQWQQYLNGSSIPQPASGSGASTLYFTTPVLTDSIAYRLKVTCNASGLSDSTPLIKINVPRLTYAAIPFTEDFESWSNRCATSDVPSNAWTNIPSTGFDSWRRNDQGVATAGWNSNTGAYSPAFAHGAYSARFHTWDAQYGTSGAISAYLNCSTIAGNKELQFYYNNPDGSDSLVVTMSVDSGATFTTLGTYYTTSGWELETLPVVSNSPKTIIRFNATSDYGASDIGIDYVRVLPPCSGKPTAGSVTQVTPCPNTDFNLSLTGTTQSAGLTYQWQQMQNGVATTAGITNNTSMIAIANISQPTTYRCIVTCSNSGLSDTSAEYTVQLAPFYMCYCNSAAVYMDDDDIGNVKVIAVASNDTLLNNGIASPLVPNSTSTNTYTDFRTTVPPVPVFRDSVYNLWVTQIDQYYFYTCTAVAFIDYNRNGIFETTENIFSQVTGSATQTVNANFTVPDSAHIGITGFRVILAEGTGGFINPCGTSVYYYGETEDYLVDINMPPCDGPTNPGIVACSDTAMCTGYPFHLTDTTHEHFRSGIAWVWQESTNNGSTWNDIANSSGKDTLTLIFTGASSYRLKMTCSNTNDITYSNVVFVNSKPPYKCYCYSTANGDASDTSDIGAFSIGDFIMTTGGPHLRNPQATHGRTDYTDYGPIELYIDTTYSLSFYHTMDGSQHADARITMFMDFNNNLAYDVPSERITLANNISSAGNWFLLDNITIPTAAILNVPTGMRIILNNNVGPNVPSDEACGPYTSGETEDYTVIFRSANPLSVGNISNMKDLFIYPNPTTGKFAISFNAGTEMQKLQIRVANVTGQQIMLRSYDNVKQFHQELDMSEQAKGVYFIEFTADGQKMIRKLVVR